MKFFTVPRRGFTFVEVLVAVAILAILSSIAYGSLGEARKKARDSQRVSDLEQIQLALRMYKDVTSEYPTGYDSGAVIGSGSSFDALIDPYIGGSIKDPLDSGNYRYYYDSDFDCAVAGAGKKVLYAMTVERSVNANWASVCGTPVPGSTETYGVILE